MDMNGHDAYATSIQPIEAIFVESAGSGVDASGGKTTGYPTWKPF